MRVRLHYKDGRVQEEEPVKLEVYEFRDFHDQHDEDELYQLQFVYFPVNLEG